MQLGRHTNRRLESSRMIRVFNLRKFWRFNPGVLSISVLNFFNNVMPNLTWLGSRYVM